MSRHTPATPKPEEHYRVASVLEVLAEYGIHVARETINRVSDTVLELDTRSTGMFDRRWTRSQIDDLAAAFRLREQRGLTWDGVANALSSPPFAEQLDQEMEEVRAQLKQLAERANDLAEFANLIADDPDLAPSQLTPTRGVAASRPDLLKEVSA